MASKTLKAFTMAAIEKVAPAAPGKRDTYAHPKIPGLKLRVTDAGIKSFFFEGRVKGGPKMNQTIGRFPACTVDDAEKAAKRLSSQLMEGIDPRAARRKFKIESTFEELFKWYISEGAELKPKTLLHYQSTFKNHLDDLGKRKASQVTKADIRDLHARISKKAPYAANRMLALVKAIYSAALNEDKYDGQNPADGIKANREQQRETRLLPGQIKSFFEALDSYPDADIRDFFWLCLLTGQRKGSLLAMRWADIHLDDRLWIIPDTKNNRPHNVPLLEAELAILKARKATSRSPWVFPSHGKQGHLVDPKKAWASILTAAGIPKGDLRIHDLRRSLGSFMVDCGASLPTIGKTLGHLSPLTTAIYARLCLDPVREAKQKAHDGLFAARRGSESASQ